MPLSLQDQFPLRLLLGGEDASYLLGDNFNFSNIDPGGFESASFNLPKDMPQTLRGTPIRIDSGLRVAWEGRVSQVQRSLGNKTVITGEGYGAQLKERSASMIFVDRDLTRWIAPSNTRQVALASGALRLGDSIVAADRTNQLPALVQHIRDSWVAPNKPFCEAWYDSGPQNLIAQVYYSTATSVALGAPWNANLIASTDDVMGSTLTSSNLVGGASGYYTPASQYRFNVAQFNYNANPGGAQGNDITVSWRNMAVYGNHGLPLQGSDPKGLYPSDIAKWIIGQSSLKAGVVTQTDLSNYIMAHSVYYVPVGLDQMLNDMSVAQGWHWGVWDSLSPLTGDPTPRIDFRPRPQPGTFTAFCRRADTVECDVREDLSLQFNQATVTFTNPAGVQDAVTVSAYNPILAQAGINRTTILAGGTMTRATASVFGLEALALLYAQARVVGTVQMEQAIDGPSGPKAPWLLKAGIDRLRVGDLPSFDVWGAQNDLPLTRVECSGSSSGFQTHLEVGQGGNLVETLQARIAAATALAAQGGT